MIDRVDIRFDEDLRNRILKMRDSDQNARFRVVEFHEKNGWDKPVPPEITEYGQWLMDLMDTMDTIDYGPLPLSIVDGVHGVH